MLMKSMLRLLTCALFTFSLIACTPKMVAVNNVHDQPVRQGLSQDDVRKLIHEAAATKNWSTRELAPGRILATYNERSHTIEVVITYTENSYGIDYSNTKFMKVYCTEEDKEARRRPDVTDGSGTCPGVDQPAYIHNKYQEWVDELNHSIKLLLQ